MRINHLVELVKATYIANYDNKDNIIEAVEGMENNIRVYMDYIKMI